MGTKVVQANKETLGTKAVLVGTKAVLAIKETLETKVALANKETLETKADLAIKETLGTKAVLAAIKETLGTKALLVKKANKCGAIWLFKTKVNKLFAEFFELNRRGSGNNELLGQKRFCENKKTRANLPANNETLGTMRLWQENNGGNKNGAGAALGKWSHGVILSHIFLKSSVFVSFLLF